MRWVAFLLFLAAACSAKVTASTSSPPTSGSPCDTPGTIAAFHGCSGCECDADHEWQCPEAADSAVGGCCTEATFGMPCDPGTGNACGGVCLLGASGGRSKMLCVPADSQALDGLLLSSLDGVPCSASGVPGSDCGHACV